MSLALFVGVLSDLLFSVPVIIVWLVGAILAIVKWRKHPIPSALILFALGLFFLSRVVSASVSTILPVTLHAQYSPQQISMILAGTGSLFSLVNTLAWALIIAAMFGWRGAYPEKAAAQAPSEPGE